MRVQRTYTATVTYRTGDDLRQRSAAVRASSPERAVNALFDHIRRTRRDAVLVAERSNAVL